MTEVSIQDTLDTSDCRELGDKAVWSLSTAKPGNGIEQVRDDNLETFWQSDGTQPHYLNIQFLRKTSISKISFYIDYNLDESYTPKKISIRSGSSMHDLLDLTAIDLHEPIGWVSISLNNSMVSNSTEDISTNASHNALRTHLLQIQVHTMHQNGRDTHIRQIKIFGPRPIPIVMGNFPLTAFQTIEMSQFALLR
mmetsp:Transcript_7531/g.7757  ORF Transcript_7531/g.7757 Transcript_7531/m.7757 type:complete len:195 (+) Transcript_7531:220-804(+)